MAVIRSVRRAIALTSPLKTQPWMGYYSRVAARQRKSIELDVAWKWLPALRRVV